MGGVEELSEWLDDHSGDGVTWYVKRLSGNDTLANGSNQAGPYIPREVLFDIFPSIHQPAANNPDRCFDLRVDSHGDARQVRAVWYNNRVRGKGTRNEARLTNFGGETSALLDPESTGSLAVFAFHRGPAGDADVCHAWVCDFEVEADLVEDRIGPVEPGMWRFWSPDDQAPRLLEALPKSRSSCWLEPSEMPPAWLVRFPTGEEIIRRTVELRSDHGASVDERLMRRRQCEYEIFRSVEQAIELPAIARGFARVDEFVARAQTVLQRRKSRSGRSLELHAREIFREENLAEGKQFEHQPESDPGKRPDFIFPNAAAYRDPSFPASRLRMLAAKTTCKDRWRQVINEADRIETKHLLTLQEGISVKQFAEMTAARVQLVVPAPLMDRFPSSIRPNLQSLESFIADIRLACLSS